MIASRLLKTFGTHPLMLMWGFMLVTGVLSMWMSNTATTAMMMAMALPMLKQMDPKDPFRTGLLLSIPFAANIGGVATPIGTPPNAIAIGILANEGVRVSFLGWMKMALPLAIVMMTVTSGILYWMFKPKQNQLSFQISAPPRMDGRARLVMGIGLLTAVLWLTSEFHKVPSALIALLAAGLLSVTGLMDRDDFKNIDWDVLVLMWGGLSLGKALDISGLDAWIVGLPLFDQNGFLLIAVFCVLAIVLSTFMSNTATANLVVPVAVAIPGENHVLLAATIALSCSFAMALPISTPPNAIAFASKMLKSGDMLKAGLLVSAVSVALLLLGYRVMISGALFPGGINP